jgi:hypothetical protein
VVPLPELVPVALLPVLELELELLLEPLLPFVLPVPLDDSLFPSELPSVRLHAVCARIRAMSDMPTKACQGVLGVMLVLLQVKSFFNGAAVVAAAGRQLDRGRVLFYLAPYVGSVDHRSYRGVPDGPIQPAISSVRE